MKAFLIYKDKLSVLDKMDDAEAGRLFKCIAAYHLGKQDVVNELRKDRIVDIVFAEFELAFEDAEIRWEKICERNRENGKKGGRPKTQNNPNKPNGFFGNPNEPKITQNNPNTNTNTNINTNNIISLTMSRAKEILSSESSIEFARREYKLSREEVIQYIEQFCNLQDYVGKTHLSEQDLKSHFINWLNIKVKENGKDRKQYQSSNEAKQAALERFVNGR